MKKPLHINHLQIIQEASFRIPADNKLPAARHALNGSFICKD